MGRILLLTDDVIDKIAAGEVVESPAAVVKELVENSLDAKASSISIEIKAGGFQLIRVDDDGCGMEEEDALVSLQRHTTSKIVYSEDLFSLHTMGFRGEALASIAAVSKLTLRTKAEGEALEMQAEGGKVLGLSPAPREQGTTIEVRSLFYNTPARKAFQKTASASTAEIIRLITALSLSHPEIAFTLTSQEKPLIQTHRIPSNDSKQVFGLRLQSVLGESFFSKASWIEKEKFPYKVFGFIGSPEFTRPNRLGQYLFLNRRWIQTSPISLWVKDAYGTFIQEGLHPHFMLHIEMPRDHLDVNVHPQKREVRLKEQLFLKELIKEAVLEGLSPPSKELSFEAPAFTPTAFSFREEPLEEKFQAWEQASLWKTVPSSTPPQILFLAGPYLLVKGKIEGNKIEGGEEIVVVDLKAAYAKCLFDLFGKPSEKIESAQLFLPITLEFTKEEVSHLEGYRETLSSSGWEIRILGERTIAIDAYPAVLSEGDLSSLLHGLLEENSSSTNVREVASFCSRFARSKKAFFSMEEASKIWESLLFSSSPLYCPLGTKVVIALQKEDMEGLFKK